MEEATDETSFVDDRDTVPDTVRLFRRITPKFINWEAVPDGAVPPVPSQGFQDYPAQKAIEEYGLPGACMSVGVESVLTGNDLDPAAMIKGYEGYGVAVFSAGAARNLAGPKGEDWRQGIMPDPTDEEPWHAVVFRIEGNKTRGIQNALAQLSEWIVVPARPET